MELKCRGSQRRRPSWK